MIKLAKKSKKQQKNSEKKENFIVKTYREKYKALLIIPAVLLLLSLVIIGNTYVQTGDFFKKGITLSGGITITLIDSDISSDQTRELLRAEYPDNEINVRSLRDAGRQVGIAVESNLLPEDDVSQDFIDRVLSLSPDAESNVETVGASLGDAFFRQTALAVLVAFLFMGIVVYMYFRTFVPSFAVILAAFSNIVMTVAFLNLIDFSIGTAGIAALLMLIGYSVDTDILLTTRLLKEDDGSVFERLIGALKTGLTMSVSTLSAAIITFIVAESQVLMEIIFIVIVGLIFDQINTWIQNAGMLRWHLNDK
ncbi:MAG: protein translocase subunit SecF [Candidatus Woesearchaeota archaeon]